MKRKNQRKICFALSIFLAGAFFAVPGYSQGLMLDFSDAVIVHSAGRGKHAAAAEMLRHEIQRRARINLSVGTSMPSETVPAIVLGTVGSFPRSCRLPGGLSVPARSEGYVIRVDIEVRDSPTVYLIGRDDRGALFAAGRLIRLLYLAPNYIRLAGDIRVSSAPAYPLRGHQIISSIQCEDGFVDWYDAAQKREYISELVLFGTNGFEMRPPGDVDDFLEELGIDLFINVPCQEVIGHSRLSDKEIRGLYTDLTGVDHFTTYGGDATGSRPPMEVFPKMERVIPLLLESHLGARWWYSNQCLDDHALDYDDYIFDYINTKRPGWLYGIVYGPWTKRGIPEIRAELPSRYKIRHYPENCHVRRCQYPVPGWDRVWAQIWPRNHSIYAMPRMMAQIHNATCRGTVGALAYNHTGCYNDLNKFIWSSMGWNPDGDPEDVLYDYGRVFFAYDFRNNPVGDNPSASRAAIIDAGASIVARGLELLEENWQGHLADNTSAETALKLWKKIANSMGGADGVMSNWRLEMFLYKAFIDAQVKRKYDAEMKYQRQAYKVLGEADKIGVAEAVNRARSSLAKIDTEFQSEEDFKKELKSWGLSEGFGELDEILDNIYSPLNDRRWLEARLDDVESLADISRIVDYEEAGPGGFYDNLGVAGEQPHLVRQKKWREDPGFVHSPIEWIDHKPGSKRRHSQMTHATCRYDTPLIMRWEGFDPEASYHIEVVYLGPFGPEFTCETNDGFVIHGPRGNTGTRPVSYSIPQASTSDGALELQWKLVNRVRGVSVTEIWLKKD